MLPPDHRNEDIPALDRCAGCLGEFSPLQELFAVVIGRLRPLFCDKQCFETWLRRVKGEDC